MYKVEFLRGLENFVKDELESVDPTYKLLHEFDGVIYFQSNLRNKLKSLKTVNNLYKCIVDKKCNPKFLAGNLNTLEEALVIFKDDPNFGSFNLDIAGHNTNEARRIKAYISKYLNLQEQDGPDLQVNYGKKEKIGWEISFRMTPRPLSKRTWRVANIEGGLNPSLAYCMNVLSKPSESQDYLNLFSGSGTLLIERANWKYQSLKGFDNNGLNNSLAYKNIRASKNRDIEITKADIYGSPKLGSFDAIVGDIPFGMQIGSESNLKSLYTHTLNYCTKNLNPGGYVVLLTSQKEMFEPIIEKHKGLTHINTYEVILNTNREEIRECGIYLFQNVNK